MYRSLFIFAVAVSLAAGRGSAIGPVWAELEVAAVTGSIADVGRIRLEVDLLAPTRFTLDDRALSEGPDRAIMAALQADQSLALRLAPTVEVNVAPIGRSRFSDGGFGDWDDWARAGRESNAALFMARVTVRF